MIDAHKKPPASDSLDATEADFEEAARIDRERSFHNDRFEHDDREAQLKYYAAVEHCMDRFDARLDELVVDADILEYGCSYGDNCVKYSGRAKSVTGIDISDVAISQGQTRVKKAGCENVCLEFMNAEATEFEDNTFDLVFGSGIIHHLEVSRSLHEIYRVLRPGGRALFIEPLGHNPVIELYRRVTPNARTPDEHPLLKQDFKTFDKVFAKSDYDFFGLSTLAVVPFRKSGLRGPILSATRAVDRGLFAVPGIKWWAWYAIMEGQKAVKET